MPLLALLVVVAAMRISPAIEINIRREAVKLAQGAEDDPLVKAGARVSVAGRDVRIVTDADLPEDVRSEARRRALAVPGVRSAASEVTGYVTLSPFVFTVRRSESGIELSGGVPSADIRARLVQDASRLVGNDRVEDRLRLAAGAPPGFADIARHLIATIGPVQPGEATLSDRRVEASAGPGDSLAYNTVMTSLRALPPGYILGSADIVPPRISPFVWTARRDAGGIALSGSVPSEAYRAALLALAQELSPDLPVRDAMQTARGLDRSIDFMASARSAFDVLARVRSGEAQIVDRRFSLNGETVAKGGGAAIARRLQETLPSGLGTPAVSITVIPASPYLFAARRAGGRLELTGYLPDEQDRITTGSLAASRFPGERLVDRLIVADGAPEGFQDAMRSLLATLSDFAEGEAVIRDREISYSGRVLYGQLAARIRRTVPAQVLPGWRAKVDLEPVRGPGALDAYLCGDLLGDVARKHPVRFVPGQAATAANAGPAIDATADILRRCGHVGVRLVHHLGASADREAAKELAVNRARALAAALSERGATARFSAEGVVAEKEADRTEFQVTPL